MVDKRTMATVILVVTWVSFGYYTIWILVTPALDDNFWMQDYFPDPMYGIMLTSLMAYIILAYIFTFAGIALITESDEKPLPDSASQTQKDELASISSNPNEANKAKND